MNIIKRDGSEAIFKGEKIFNAIKSANRDVSDEDKLSEEEIDKIVKNITEKANSSSFALHVEDIQDMVEDEINDRKKFKLGRAYSQYRTKHMISRNDDTFNKKALAIVDYNSEETKQENSNKDPSVINVQRDYLAGEVSKKIAREVIFDSDLMQAHDEGLIHIHDLDYAINHSHNCDLIDLEDMFTNGTVISKEMIETPKSFGVACNVMTQIMAQVASSQFGGQSMTLSHIAPFVDVSRQKIKRKLLEDFEVNSYDDLDESDKKIFNKIWKHRLHDEIVDGVQTIQYQISTLMTSNGQTPFVTLFMYLDEVEDGQLRDDLALVIEEVLKLRIKGMKNEKGIYTTPAFPKLIYVLDEDNITEDSKYWYLTKLAAECTAKRMVPDYISAKVMKELKDGYVYPCMG